MSEMQIQLVKEEDCELLWKWVNDPETRNASFYSNPITWEQHCKWFAGKLNSSDCIIYLAIINKDKPLGQVRFDVKKNTAIISLSIAKEFRGMGIGSNIIQEAYVKFFTEKKIQTIQALIKKENMSSINAFKKAGFVKTNQIEHLGFPTIIMECRTK